ncbi:outer membrane beta-barrel protein [Pontibacter oryzae]|uniref:Outer membrane protein beta-barrel domain-containing protein n=1 Tax=Pontibacter oryzae TaxID=2304593 RepID=A0A399RW54_9BACT|nr:outer membrane beta-barrel protein [Pontibacter oryzae]RIJ34077.1 hypothetical protein D1627_17085 [Pontibacter oryzae]
MKRFILIILVIFTGSLCAMAQDNAPIEKHTMYLQVGVATPKGDFGSADFEDDYPDFADQGPLLQAGYRYRFSKFFAAGGSVTYRYNKFRMDAFVDDSDDLVTDKEARGWQSAMALADMYALYPLPDETTILYAKASAGASVNRSASWRINTVYGSLSMPADNASASAFGWAVGIMLRAKPVELYVESGMLYTKPAFTVAGAQGNRFKHKQAMNTLHVSLGVSYTL